MIYQRACGFIRETPVVAQQLFSSELDAGEFLLQISSWWEKRPEPRPANGQQVQNSVQLDSPQELRTSVSLGQNGNGQAGNDEDENGSVIPLQSGSFGSPRGLSMVEERTEAPYGMVEPATSSIQQKPFASSTPFEQSSTLDSEGGMKPAKSNDISDSPSIPETVPKEHNYLSQDSTGEIPNHGPTSSLAEVIIHPVISSNLITNTMGENDTSRFAENQPIRAVPLNNSVVTKVNSNSNVKVDKSDKPDDSLSTTSSSSGEVPSSSSKMGLLQRIFGS